MNIVSPQMYIKARLKWTETNCPVVKKNLNLKFFLKNMDVKSSRLKRRGTIWVVMKTQLKSLHL